MTDSEGEIVWQATYRSWGTIEQLAVNEVEQNLRFQGQYFDDETGLHYNTLRYYDPEVGRFFTQDPLGLEGGNNLYAYVPSPITWVDPLGLAACPMREVNGAKIFGKGQKDGTPGHDQFSEAIANKLAMSGKFKEIYLNRSYSFANGKGVSGRRPDIMAVDSSGRVHAIELASKTDMGSKLPSLTGRNQAAMSNLPKAGQGNIVVLKHPYNASKIKSVLDNLIDSI
ncbi:putative deoxyribonuclease RhsC [compost metagenome]